MPPFRHLSFLPFFGKPEIHADLARFHQLHLSTIKGTGGPRKGWKSRGTGILLGIIHEDFHKVPACITDLNPDAAGANHYAGLWHSGPVALTITTVTRSIISGLPCGAPAPQGRAISLL